MKKPVKHGLVMPTTVLTAAFLQEQQQPLWLSHHSHSLTAANL